MTYFLDFDRTLFDTEAYYAYLVDKPQCSEFRHDLQLILEAPVDGLGGHDELRRKIWKQLSVLLETGALSFSPGELSPFLYPDVVEFLRQMGNEAMIITFGDKIRQKAKVESALAGVVRLTVLYTQDVYKADFLTSNSHLVSGKALFVDDYARELEKMALNFPEVSLYQMRRNKDAGDGRWPILSTLHELP